MNEHVAKVVFIGDPYVGKTSLLERYTSNTLPDPYTTTIGVDFFVSRMKVGDIPVKLQIWDTAGQERFLSISSSYFRTAMIAVVVYDVTNMESYRGATKWMNIIYKEARSDVRMILVANKCDDTKTRQVSQEHGIDMANMHGIHYIETSSKANTGVSDLMALIAREAVVHFSQANQKTSSSINLNAPSKDDTGSCCW